MTQKFKNSKGKLVAAGIILVVIVISAVVLA